MPDVLKAAHAHEGAAFIEIFQNCIVYNKDVFNDFAAPKGAGDNQLWLEHDKPMLFGDPKAGFDKGIALDRDTLQLKVVEATEENWEEAGVLVHDAKNRVLANMLIEMPFGPFPMALGVVYDDPAPTFEAAVAGERAKATKGKTANLAKLLGSGQTWTVDPNEGHPTD